VKPCSGTAEARRISGNVNVARAVARRYGPTTMIESGTRPSRAMPYDRVGGRLGVLHHVDQICAVENRRRQIVALRVLARCAS